MKRPDDFETQEQFDSYVDYMMGNPADDWGLPERVKVYWCNKAEGHWDVDGCCGSHLSGEYVWWPEHDVYDMPPGKDEAGEVLR